MKSESSLSILNRIRADSKMEQDPDQEGWMVSYADLITLLFVFFAILLSISSISKVKLDMLNQQMNHQAQTSLSQLKQEIDNEVQRQKLVPDVSTEMTADGLQVQFSERVLFASGEALVSEEGMRILKAFCPIIANMKGAFHVAVEGHTDSRPIHTAQFPSNWALSSSRAVNVLHLLAANGVDEKRMMVRGYSDTRPNPGSPDVGDGAKNRRVTLLVF